MAPELYMDDTDDIPCQLIQYSIQLQHDKSVRHLWYHYWVSTLSDKYSLVQENKQTLFFSSSWFQTQINSQLQTIYIDNLYVIIWCVYHAFVELSKCGSNSQFSMLAFHKEKKVSRNNKCQVILPMFML